MLYKYRELNNFKYFIDILVKNRLYASPYLDLNDPMEGHYFFHDEYNKYDRDMRDLIKGEKDNLRICSLTRDSENELMWSHYSDGHKGLVIGVEVKENYAVRPVVYDGLPVYNNNTLQSTSAIEILSHKLLVWEYEQEERVFVESSHYIDVDIQEIIFGRRMSNQDKSLIQDLINSINPSIKIRTARSRYLNKKERI